MQAAKTVCKFISERPALHAKQTVYAKMSEGGNLHDWLDEMLGLIQQLRSTGKEIVSQDLMVSLPKPYENGICKSNCKKRNEKNVLLSKRGN